MCHILWIQSKERLIAKGHQEQSSTLYFSLPVSTYERTTVLCIYELKLLYVYISRSQNNGADERDDRYAWKYNFSKQLCSGAREQGAHCDIYMINWVWCARHFNTNKIWNGWERKNTLKCSQRITIPLFLGKHNKFCSTAHGALCYWTCVVCVCTLTYIGKRQKTINTHILCI